MEEKVNRTKKYKHFCDDTKSIKAAYLSFCDHIASGKSLEGWHCEYKGRKWAHQTMRRYMAEFPALCPPCEMEVAVAKGFAIWEEIGLSMLNGQRKAEAGLYQVMMRNKFGWDKKDSSSSAQDAEALQQLKETFRALSELRYQSKPSLSA